MACSRVHFTSFYLYSRSSFRIVSPFPLGISSEIKDLFLIFLLYISKVKLQELLPL